MRVLCPELVTGETSYKGKFITALLRRSYISMLYDLMVYYTCLTLDSFIVACRLILAFGCPVVSLIV